MSCDKELEQLHADALARQLLETAASRDTGRQPFRIGCSIAIGGVKAEEAENAQVILGDAARCIADEPHAPRGDVRKPADVVVELPLARGRKRIHCEVPALGITLPVPAKGYLRAPPEGLDILA